MPVLFGNTYLERTRKVPASAYTEIGRHFEPAAGTSLPKIRSLDPPQCAGRPPRIHACSAPDRHPLSLAVNHPYKQHQADLGAAGKLQRLELRCPPLPMTMIQIMDLLHNPRRLTPQTITEAIRHDPLAAAHILHVVNTSFYGVRTSVGDIERAVAILGPAAAAGIVMGLNIAQMRRHSDAALEGHYLEIVRHSIATEFLTRTLIRAAYDYVSCDRLPVSMEKIAYSAALLHDFGKLVLMHSAPDAAQRYLAFATSPYASPKDDPREIERLYFGYDHIEAGEYSVRKLGLPVMIELVIRFHHEPARCRENGAVIRTVRTISAADTAATGLGFFDTVVQNQQEGWMGRVLELMDMEPAYEPALRRHLEDARREIDNCLLRVLN